MNNLDKVLSALGLSERHNQLIKDSVEMDVANVQEEYKKQRAEERKKEEESKLNFSKMGLRERQELRNNNRELYEKLAKEELERAWK
ncbi:MAG: hypothetical protein Q3988_01060 [Gemella sp.]|nr:hypothetical protein [Gemella sp.]